MFRYLRYAILVCASRLLKPIVSVCVVAPFGRVSEKKSDITALPWILKSSTRNVFEICSLSVARNVTAMSPSVFGRWVSPVMLYWPRLRVLGVDGSGPGGQLETLGCQFVPE